MSIRAGASWGAIVLSAGLLAYAAQPASANLLTNGDFATCPPPPVASDFGVNSPATHNRWNGTGWACTDTPAAPGNATQYGRQNEGGSTNEILQGVPLAGSCVAPGDKVKLTLRYVYQGSNSITNDSAEVAARLFSFEAGGTWSANAPWAMGAQTELEKFRFTLRGDWSDLISIGPVEVPAGAVALGVALRMGYQGGQGPGTTIHGVDDVSLTLASFTANVNVDPDTLNLRSRGNQITAYISVPVSDCISASAGDINVSTVKITSIDGTPVSLSATRSNLQGSVLMVKFDRAAVQTAILGLGLTLPAFVDVVIEGELDDGTSFTATDQIRAINP